jgi:alpha-L-fucosidase
MQHGYLNMTISRTWLTRGLAVTASLAATAWAAEPAASAFAPNQPHRPADFKPHTFPSPLALKEKHSEDMMRRADDLMGRVRETNAKGTFKPEWDSLMTHKAPEWFLDAKFGMFIDWSIYTVPGCPPLEGYDNWVENRFQYGNAEEKVYFAKTWGEDFKRDDFITQFTAKNWDPERLTQLALETGMKYVVPFSKHHSGYCQWPSSFTFRNSVAMPPHRDLTGPLVEACRKKGLKFGLYFSQDEWEYPVLDAQREVNVRGWGCPVGGEYTEAKYGGIMSGKVPVRDFYDQYINPQLVEALDLYRPDILWLDGDWIHHVTTRKFMPVVAYWYNQAAARGQEVLVNDRLGETRRIPGPGQKPDPNIKSLGDFYVSEVGYQPGEEMDLGGFPWEENIGISRGFGYDWRDTDKDLKTPQYLIHMLLDVVANGGNLLLAVGPDASGKLNEDYLLRLREIGQWMSVNGEGIYATRRWVQGHQGPLRFTRSKDGKTVYVFSTQWPGQSLKVKNLRPREGSAITMLGVKEPLQWSLNNDELTIDIPESVAAKRPCAYAWGFKLQAQPVLAIRSAETMFIPGSSVKAELRGTDAKLDIRYTLDGSAPTDSSPLYTAPVEIASTCRLTAQFFEAGKAVGLPVQQEYRLDKDAGSVMPDVLLESLEPVKIERGWTSGLGRKDWRKFNCTGKPLSINGRQYANGVGLCAKAEAVFAIKPEYERFVTGVGVDDAGKQGTVKVIVYGDDKRLFETAVLRCSQAPVNIDVRIPSGVDGRRPAQLRIVVEDAGDGINDDHTDLVNAGFVTKGGKGK